jgi:hypothetical protein
VFTDLLEGVGVAKNSHHPDPLAIGTDPGRPIAETPLVLFKTFFADHKTAGTAPAEFLFLLAAVTDIVTGAPPAIP